MKKTNIIKAVESLPDIIGSLKDWAKDSFEEHAQTVLDNSSGTIGLAIKLIAKPVIEAYFEKVSIKKLDNFGVQTYAKSAYIQACKSILIIEDNIEEISVSEIQQSLLEAIDYQLQIVNSNQLLLVFQSKYHPAVVSTKKAFIKLLIKFNTNQNHIDLFNKDFNDNIESIIHEEFGTDYTKHLEDIKKFLFKTRETELLLAMINLGKIGFSEDEDLLYETTFAEWREVQSLNAHDFSVERENSFITAEDVSNFLAHEDSLKPASDLIDTYFKVDPSNHIDKILFIIADFGKGKSVFLKHHASYLAKEYIITGEGYIPVYFNLRNFNNYSPNSSLGVIHDYLLTEFAIDINSDYYKSKKYFFLIDSLDESGELNKASIEKVIDSIKRIQNIDKSLYRSNRIVITSRPFDGGLKTFLEQFKPYKAKNKLNKDTSMYISIYGFKSNQFNNWLNNTLLNSKIELNSNSTELIQKITDNLTNNNKADIYNILLDSKTLSRSELQRPIFAYMIYQLIVNNIDFLRIGKIGVYLSFLNLLSKEAKHINDPSYKVNLKEEFEFRNILHAISSLWMYERHQGKQGALNKADICRVLDGEKSGESDEVILARYKDQKVLEIEFLSHSYFGENSNTLHFQHQSFAEILLAEYYLKVFIKYALDEDSNKEEARTKLMLGNPTDQTINFFKELLQLLREASSSIFSEQVIQKRKLLFPLLASLSIRKNNPLLCNELSYNWFKKYDFDETTTDYPESLLNNWCINSSHLTKICNLSKKILNSKNTYYITESERKNSLFNQELTLIKNKNLHQIKTQMDKWLALITGNTLYNDTSSHNNIQLFNKDYVIDYVQLFELIDNSYDIHNGFNSLPRWGNDQFKGIDMQKNDSTIFLQRIFGSIDFSYSNFSNIEFMGSIFVDTKFSNCSFNETSFTYTSFFRPDFTGIIYARNPYRSASNVNVQNFLLPFDLFNNDQHGPYNQSHSKIIIPNLPSLEEIESSKLEYELDYASYYSFLDTIRPFLKYQIKTKRITIQKINNHIKFENKKNKTDFFNSIK